MNITLVRHPETTANESHIIYGHTDYPYTDLGKDQMNWVKDYMTINYGMNHEEIARPNIRIISSPKGRALKLARAISAELNIECEVNEQISEMNFGIFEGLTLDEAMEKFPDGYQDFRDHFDTTRIPEGESYNDFIARIEVFIQYITSLKHEDTLDEIIVVSHGGVIRELLERLLAIEPGESWKFLIENGCIIKLVLRDDGCQLKELIANKY